MAESIARGMGGDIEFEVLKGYPYLKNDEAFGERSRQYAAEYLGEENIVDLDIWMAAEDFAYYSHLIPACFYRLGVGNEKKGITTFVHKPTFNIDEDALETGMGLMAWMALNELNTE